MKLELNAKVVEVYKLQSARRVKISLEICEKLGWKEGDRIVELVDEEKKAVILIKREDYEKLIGGGQ